MDFILLLQSIALILLVNSDLCINQYDDGEYDSYGRGHHSRHSRYRPSVDDYDESPEPYAGPSRDTGVSRSHHRHGPGSDTPRWSHSRRGGAGHRASRRQNREWYDNDDDDDDDEISDHQSRNRGIQGFSGLLKRSKTKGKMMHIAGPPVGGGSGGKANANSQTEEVVSAEGVRRRAVHKRTKADGLGKSMSEDKCGISSDLSQRIVGGQDAPDGAHPWIVAILKDGEAWCGGSIINPNWILTAAHCFMGDEPDKSTWAIRVGTNNRNQGRTYKIKKVVTHERFNLDNMLNSDIALMLVAKPIEYDKKISPICFPDNSFDEPRATKSVVAGWGAIEFDNENLPVNLQDVTLNIVTDKDCAKKYKQKKYTLYKSQFCTWNYKKDACQGDSGGPAIEIVDGKATQIGVVSYGSTCADDFPGVYTQVSYFLTWIQNTMKEHAP